MAIIVWEIDPGHLPDHRDGEADLFFAFPDQSCFKRFAGFDFTAREFPAAWKAAFRATAGNEEALPIGDEACCDDDSGRA